MAGETAAIRRLQCGVPLPAAELLETERLLADHVRRHGDSRPVRAALEDVRARIDRTDARATVAAEAAAARVTTAAGVARVGGTVRHEGFGGVRFDGDLRPPAGRARGRAGAVLLVAAVAAGILGAVVLGQDDDSSAVSSSSTNTDEDATNTDAGDSARVPVGAVNAGAPTGEPLQVSRAAFRDSGRDWPLTVEAGVLSCEGVSSVVFAADTGGRYALNGTAETHTSWPSIEPLWADAPGQPGLKVDLGDLIQAGLTLC